MVIPALPPCDLLVSWILLPGTQLFHHAVGEDVDANATSLVGHAAHHALIVTFTVLRSATEGPKWEHQNWRWQGSKLWELRQLGSLLCFVMFSPKPYVRTSMLAILVTHNGIDRRKITWNPNKNIRLEHALPIEIQPFDGFHVLTIFNLDSVLNSFSWKKLHRDANSSNLHPRVRSKNCSASWGYYSPGQIMV